MANEGDLAQAVEEMHREEAIKKMLRNNVNTGSTLDCVECGDPIPEERRKVGNIKTCIFCQQIIEKKNRK